MKPDIPVGYRNPFHWWVYMFIVVGIGCLVGAPIAYWNNASIVIAGWYIDKVGVMLAFIGDAVMMFGMAFNIHYFPDTLERIPIIGEEPK